MNKLIEPPSWESIKYDFFESGIRPELELDQLPILDSWQKAKNAGLTPHNSIVNKQNFEIQSLSYDDQQLARLTQPYLEDIFNLYKQQNISVFLINNMGLIVKELHDDSTDGLYDFLKVGRVVSEENFGTIAPICSIDSRLPMALNGHQHYLKEFSSFSCASVPIFNGRGDILGALDITSKISISTGNWLNHLLHQSYKFENEFIRNTQEATYFLYFQNTPDLIGGAYSGLIAFNQDSYITHMNQVASQLIGCQIKDAIGAEITQIFANIEALMHHSSDIHLLKKNDHAFCYAKMIHPQKKMSQVGDIKLQKCIRAIQADIPILITGETGTGKEFLAQQIHDQFKKLPFISINCGAIPDNLLESELFGYEGGAFTGAKAKGQIGLVEMANGGFLFLDELGDLPIHLQVKVLRVLQDNTFYRVGGRTALKSNFKLICATNRNLKNLVDQGLFRSDLYYRIRGYEIELSPLRDRDDKLTIANSILENLGDYRYSDKVKAQILNYAWPGNIRELINVLKISAVFSDDLMITELLLQDGAQVTTPLKIESTSDLDGLTRETIKRVYQEENMNVTKVAKRLNISRSTVYKYLNLCR
ncbi:sigma-54-dependent Fis family transcriptional regulator [Acinetobacter sp. ANC 3832]|uniref:sigma-54-dependent Fis family transcriptional regulator n=1 Tax=Acinetobacter sp. ANC 3832 TaxID=1977874 RepID=UPI000A32EFBF|nr:sigma 54-interacting transcriptional regulator [Acinetobacter sp. ANC 3832]OTG88764.1 hypothetical protein B9T35_17055 [Acinetobacter sp. ANC 3832]